LNSPRGCKTGATITIGFELRILFKGLLKLSQAQYLLIRRMLKMLSHELLDDFQLFREVVSKYFAHIFWTNKHVGEDGFARANLLHDSLQAFQLMMVLELVALRNGRVLSPSYSLRTVSL